MSLVPYRRYRARRFRRGRPRFRYMRYRKRWRRYPRLRRAIRIKREFKDWSTEIAEDIDATEYITDPIADTIESNTKSGGRIGRQITLKKLVMNMYWFLSGNTQVECQLDITIVLFRDQLGSEAALADIYKTVDIFNERDLDFMRRYRVLCRIMISLSLSKPNAYRRVRIPLRCSMYYDNTVGAVTYLNVLRNGLWVITNGRGNTVNSVCTYVYHIRVRYVDV